jgi:hypothetical protein
MKKEKNNVLQVREKSGKMATKYAGDVNSIEDLVSFIVTDETKTTNNRIRGLIIVPGGDGKTTLVNRLKSTNIKCADIDHYWDQEKQKEYVNKLTLVNFIKR